MSQVGNSSVQSGQTNKKMTHKCEGCKKQVTKTDRGLKCEYCGAWFHIEGENVTNDEYDFIENHREQLHWFFKVCNSCRATETGARVEGQAGQIRGKSGRTDH